MMANNSNKKKYIISTLFDKNANTFTVYYSDNTIDHRSLCNSSKKEGEKNEKKESIEIPIDLIKQMDVAEYSDIKNQLNISQSDLEIDVVLRPLYLPCLLKKCFSVFTDIFNNKSRLFTDSTILMRAIYICENEFDFNLFKHAYGLQTVSNDKRQNPQDYYIHINPEVEKTNSIFTLVPENKSVFCTFFVYNIFSINVVGDNIESDSFLLMHENDFSKTFKPNFEISAGDALKAILMKLTFTSITINLSYYFYIENLIDRYRQYRPIKITGIKCGTDNLENTTVVLENGFVLYEM